VAEQVAIVRSGRGHILRSDCDGWRLLPLADLAGAVAGLAQHGWPLVANQLSKLKDARPWLEVMAAPGADAVALRTLAETAIDMASVKGWTRTWGQWVASAIGTPAWLAVRDVAMDRTRVLLDAVALFNDKRKPVAPVAFRTAVVDALHLDGQLPREPLDIVLRWLEVDPGVIDVLARRGPLGLLERLAVHKETPVPVLERLMTIAPVTVRPIAWRQRLRKVDTARELLDFTRDLPPNPGHLPWSRKWFDLPGTELHTALVMAARRNGWRLRALRNHLVTQLGAEPGEAAFRKAAAEASAMLRPAAPREAAMLELVGVLGADLAASLMRVFAMADRQAAPGHKLNGAYKRHLLPKKSGGNRVISAPVLPLKRVQRAVLDTLLTPLGSHDCAYGFVPGRSIAHNAAVHVGQLVVVNADVSNCFPSVKWPLVLAALRRGLGDRLSSTAISMLCDVCTADGGLPIGAPTSPALLNRVLIKTDETLLQAAKARGVNYTRYADDLTFSGDAGAVQMLNVARCTLEQIGLQLDPKKTNIFRRGRRQMVTGLAVNDQVSVPRNIRRRLRAAVHMAVQHGTSHWHGQQQSLLALKGRISFVKMVHEAEGAQLMARLSCDHMEADISNGPAGQATAEEQAQGGDGDEA
jgi:retron-type reverse transcriptase